jgi:hypothetical protein
MTADGSGCVPENRGDMQAGARQSVDRVLVIANTIARPARYLALQAHGQFARPSAADDEGH